MGTKSENKIDLRGAVGAILIIGLCLMMLSFVGGMTGMFIYNIVGTYNERKQCEKLGIPLYRCQANSVQTDIEVKN